MQSSRCRGRATGRTAFSAPFSQIADGGAHGLLREIAPRTAEARSRDLSVASVVVDARRGYAPRPSSCLPQVAQPLHPPAGVGLPATMRRIS